MPENPVSMFSGFDAPGLEENYLTVTVIPSLQVMCNWTWPRRRRKAFKFGSASEFGHFSEREEPPASIFHQIFQFSDFASDLESAKSHVKTIFLDTTAQPIPPANISQQIDGRKLRSIGPTLRNLRRRHRNARKSGSHVHCFAAPRRE